MSETASLHTHNASAPERAKAEQFLALGISCSIDATRPADLISAHKWFNIAALCGNAEAARLRREIADEMSETEIAAAQRAAREWITRH